MGNLSYRIRKIKRVSVIKEALVAKADVYPKTVFGRYGK